MKNNDDAPIHGPDRDEAVVVALLAPIADNAENAPSAAFAELLAQAGCRILRAANCGELRALAPKLSERSVAVLDARLPDADAVRRWLKADPRRARIRVVAYNKGPADPPDRLWICDDCALDLDPGLDAERMARVVRREAERGRFAPVDAEYTVRFAFPPRPEDVSRAREWLEALLEHSPLSPDQRHLFGLAIMEAADNIRHATTAAQVFVTYTVDADGLAVEVRIEPPPAERGFAPSENFQPWRADPVATVRRRISEGRRGGLGLILLHRCADRVEYDPGRHAVTLWKAASSPAMAGEKR